MPKYIVQDPAHSEAAFVELTTGEDGYLERRDITSQADADAANEANGVTAQEAEAALRSVVGYELSDEYWDSPIEFDGANAWEHFDECLEQVKQPGYVRCQDDPSIIEAIRMDDSYDLNEDDDVDSLLMALFGDPDPAF